MYPSQRASCPRLQSPSRYLHPSHLQPYDVQDRQWYLNWPRLPYALFGTRHIPSPMIGRLSPPTSPCCSAGVSNVGTQRLHSFRSQQSKIRGSTLRLFWPGNWYQQDALGRPEKAATYLLRVSSNTQSSHRGRDNRLWAGLKGPGHSWANRWASFCHS